MILKYFPLIVYLAIPSIVAFPRFGNKNYLKDCGAYSEWMSCYDECVTEMDIPDRAIQDYEKRGIDPEEALEGKIKAHCDPKCAHVLASYDPWKLPESPKFTTEKDKCYRSCYCSNSPEAQYDCVDLCNNK